MVDYIFAYGTLRRPHNVVKKIAHLFTHLCDTTIIGRLYNINNEYPAFVHESGLVKGSLYRLEDLKLLNVLDEYEEVSSGLFYRERCEVYFEGIIYRPWLYVYGLELEAHEPILSGDWFDIL